MRTYLNKMSALAEQEKYAESLQYSLDQLTAHGEEFWTTFLKTDDLKTIIDLINTLISAATKLVDVLGTIPTIATIFGGIKGAKNTGKQNSNTITYYIYLNMPFTVKRSKCKLATYV